MGQIVKKITIWRQNESQLYTTMTISANEIILVPYYYAVRMACGKRHKTIECPSISPSVPSIDSSSRSRSGFVVDVGCEQQISIDSGPRKF